MSSRSCWPWVVLWIHLCTRFNWKLCQQGLVLSQVKLGTNCTCRACSSSCLLLAKTLVPHKPAHIVGRKHMPVQIMGIDLVTEIHVFQDLVVKLLCCVGRSVGVIQLHGCLPQHLVHVSVVGMHNAQRRLWWWGHHLAHPHLHQTALTRHINLLKASHRLLCHLLSKHRVSLSLVCIGLSTAATAGASELSSFVELEFIIWT